MSRPKYNINQVCIGITPLGMRRIRIDNIKIRANKLQLLEFNYEYSIETRAGEFSMSDKILKEEFIFSDKMELIEKIEKLFP